MTPSRRAILIVDDNLALAENLSEILTEVGYVVRSAGSCDAALAVASQSGFDVALVDIRLPDGDGTALATRLREIDGDGQVILLTGFASVESAAAAVRAGAWAYLVKPCATHDLLLLIEQALRQVTLLEERRELGRRAQVAEKLATVGTLTAGLSHEIKNPLNAAALQLAVLERRLRKLPAELQTSLLEPLALVSGEIRRLNRTLEEFLQFARPREISIAPIDLASLVGRVLDLLAPQAHDAEIRIEQQLEDSLTVAGDAARLQQVVMNLVLNAMQAAPKGGWVRVAARSNAGGAEIVIDDSGPGIPIADRERVLEPFFTTKEGGSGLGLPLVYSILQQHGGTIDLGENEVGGARFVVGLRRFEAR